MNSTPDYTFSLQETTPFTRQFRVEFVREGFDKRVETAIKKTAQRVQLNGFRKGKVPAAVVKKMFGEQVRQEVVDELFREAFESAVKEQELHVVSVEQVEVKDGDAGEITVHAALALMPKPELTGYHSVAAEVALEEFTSTTVDEEIKSILETQATTEDVTDRDVVQRGDVAIISFHMEHNGERVQGVGAEEQPVLVGDGRFLPEAEEQIIGMTVGEKKTFSVTMPKEFALEELREKPVDFVCELKSISLFIVPELTDEYARELKLGETVAEMRAKLETDLKKVFEDRNRNRKLEAVLTEIAKNNPFEIPQVLIDEEIRNILVERKFINPKKTDPKKIDVTRFRDFLGSDAETRVRNFILMERIEEQEGIGASDEDVLSFLQSQFGDANPEALKNLTENPQFLKNERFQAGAKRNKVVSMLLDGASFTVVPATTK